MDAIQIHVDSDENAARTAAVLDFITANGLAGDASALLLSGSHADDCDVSAKTFQRVGEPEANVVLQAGFLSGDRAGNQAVLRHVKVPKLFIGHHALPAKIDHVCVPFEGRRVRAPWLRRVLAEAAQHGWRVRLCYCERTIVPAGIMRLADWLHVDSVKKALSQWLTDDVRETLRDWIDEFPNTEVHSVVGSPRAVLADEDPTETIIMSSFEAGFHLPFGHRGAYYAGLLVKTGFTGYFIP